MKHLDLFSGYGGFTIPAKKYGIETINFSEIDKYAISVLKYQFPDVPNLGDISKIQASDLPDVDIITGGSPCQDLSVAGKGAGLDGARSGLFFHFIRLIKEKQPTYFVWENVKGAFSSQRGWDFARVQIEMEQAGYDVWWQLLNAKDFGVPQNRERIFAIGIRKGSGREILFEQRESVKNLEFIGGTKHRKKWLGDGKERSRNFSQGDRIYSPEGTSQNLNANGGGLGAKTGLYAIPVLTPDRVNKRQNGRRFKKNGDPSFTLTGQDRHGVMVIPRKRRTEFETSDVASTLTSHYRGAPDGDGRSGVLEGVKASYRNGLKRTEISPTIDTMYKKGFPGLGQDRAGVMVREATKKGYAIAEVGDSINLSVPNSKTRRGRVGRGVAQTLDTASNQATIQGMRIRRLTPTECERLMGLEDGWTAKGVVDGKEVDISDTQRYKMCGNGVVINCVDYIYSLIA